MPYIHINNQKYEGCLLIIANEQVDILIDYAIPCADLKERLTSILTQFKIFNSIKNMK